MNARAKNLFIEMFFVHMTLVYEKTVSQNWLMI